MAEEIFYYILRISEPSKSGNTEYEVAKIPKEEAAEIKKLQQQMKEVETQIREAEKPRPVRLEKPKPIGKLTEEQHRLLDAHDKLKVELAEKQGEHKLLDLQGAQAKLQYKLKLREAGIVSGVYNKKLETDMFIASANKFQKNNIVSSKDLETAVIKLESQISVGKKALRLLGY